MQTLYEKIGGHPAIEKLVNAFYKNVLSDPLLFPFFENSSLEKLRKMQETFFAVALGGPEPDTKISLFEAHQGRGIERKHLTRFTEHLITTLREMGVAELEAQQIYQRIGTYADDVLGDTSIDG